MTTENLLKLPRTIKFKTGLLVAVLEAVSAVALLATSAYLISRASEQPPILYLMIAVVGVRAFALARAAGRYVQRLLLHDAVFAQSTKLRPALFSRIADLTPSPKVSRQALSLERLTSDVDELHNFVLRVLTPILQALAAILTASLILAISFPLVAIAVFVLSSVGLVGIYLVTHLTTSSTEKGSIGLREELRHELLEYIEHAEVLHHYGMDSSRKTKMLEISAGLRAATGRSALAQGTATALLGLLAIATVATAGLIAPDYLAAGVPGNLLAVAVLVPLAAFDLISGVQSAAQAMVRVKASRMRIRKLISEALAPEYAMNSGPIQLDSLVDVRVQDLGLSFGNVSILDSVNLNLRSGEMVAVTGESGSGKTSLAQTLASLRNPSVGSLLINDVDSADYTLESRRKQILLVEQHPHIFAGTIAENLAISGVEDAKLQQAALEKVGLWQEVEPRGGLELQISETAANISGGQAQRLAIARGVLAGSGALILDEPTSGLDWDNAVQLMSLLRALATSGKLIVVITHDPQLAKLCDREISVTNWSSKHV